MPRGRSVIAVVAAALAGLVLLAAGCGPAGPAEAESPPLDPVTLADVIPSPEPLVPEGGARRVDPEGFVAATLGAPDPATAERLVGLGLTRAAVREWSTPDGGSMLVAVSNWTSDVVATNAGGGTAERLLDEPGGRAWTPDGLPGSRGAKADGGRYALSKAIGPNAIYVEASGDVPEDVVVRSMKRLVTVAEAQSEG